MLKVLSYNIYWEAMTVSAPGTSRLPVCAPVINDAINAISYTTCLRNVATFVDLNAPFDLVGFKEATNWQHIQLLSNTLSRMSTASYKPDREDIVTFYDNKYTLNPATPQLTGHMADTGR